MVFLFETDESETVKVEFLAISFVVVTSEIEIVGIKTSLIERNEVSFKSKSRTRSSKSLSKPP